MKSQSAEILSHLRTGSSITASYAMHNLRVYRLAARICDLRDLGYPIHTEMVKRRSKRSGRVVSHAEYSLGELI